MPPPDPNEVRAVLARPLQVVAGKGGVGRSAIAAGLALSFARRGQRTLLLEVNSADSAAARFDVAPAVDNPRPVLENLWLCRMTPEGALREYALMVLKFKALYALVFENKLVKYLLRSIPSLAEFTMLGKTWYHTTERLADGSPKYQKIIVDAPATGHAITFLSVARTVAEIAPEGIMKSASEKMAQVIESKTASCLHVVVLAEEMPVNEGLEIISAASKRLRMSVGLGFVNRLLLPLVEHEEEATFAQLVSRAEEEGAIRPFVIAGQIRRDREHLQESYARRFAQTSGLAVVRVPDLEVDRLDFEALGRIADAIERAEGGE
jgi:hypothetical protein